MNVVHAVLCLISVLNLTMFAVFALDGEQTAGVLLWNALCMSIVEQRLVSVTKSGSQFVAWLIIAVAVLAVLWSVSCALF